MTKNQKEIVKKVFEETVEKLNQKYKETSARFEVDELTIFVHFTLVKEGKERKESGTIIGLKNGVCHYSDEILEKMTKERIAKEVQKWEKALRNCFFIVGWILKEEK